MPKGVFQVPFPENEPNISYAPDSKEREVLKNTIAELKSIEIDVPMFVGQDKITTKDKRRIAPPHDHKYILGYYNQGDKSHVEQAINAALGSKEAWANLSWEHRASVFLKAADLLAGPYRSKINAATMLGQSKTALQAEIDAACELIDFLRFNVYYMQQIYEGQPESADGVWNRMEYRPLEGFIFALTPFNFTAIAGNLPTSAAMMGNTVVWKPAHTQIYSAKIIMEVLHEAGLPDGVINLIFVDGPEAGEVIFNHPEFAGLHFTGSTTVFKNLWKIIGEKIDVYKSYPRIVGETGGKDFIIAHHSANVPALSTAIVRGAYEYQGQKCSAVSRVYVPSGMWEDLKGLLEKDIQSINVGSPEDFTNFMNAVIDEKAFDKISGYIDQAKESNMAEVIIGGKYDKSEGYFIEPTVILAHDPSYVTMCEEIFGPVVTIYVYQDDRFEETLELVDNTSPYALTGAVFSKDRYAAELATEKLVDAAGNFYINDKPTGSIVGQQPFGGARGSGTNDKAGYYLNLVRWISTRTIKENFNPPTDYRYPFMEEE
ncbi:MAG TPA: L-glutamate gamma-semialdehyde dehydrogenase [Cyclobacteriaceae bacterium]